MKLPPVLSSRHKEAIFLMKRMLCVLLTLLLCAASAQADAVLDTVDYDNAAEISTKSQDGLYLYVVLEDGTAGITGYLGDETALVIPSVVDDLPVTAIGAYAFEYAALTSVVIPEGVTVIDCEAFAAASALKEITLPSTLREIGEEAFIGCALEKVTLSEGVETLGERAFAGCWNLKTITLPNTLRRMGYGVFADCDELWGLTLPASLTEIDGNPIPAIPLSQHFFANSLRIAPDNPVLRIENQMLLAGDTVICAARDVRDVTVPADDGRGLHCAGGHQGDCRRCVRAHSGADGNHPAGELGENRRSGVHLLRDARNHHPEGHCGDCADGVLPLRPAGDGAFAGGTARHRLGCVQRMRQSVGYTTAQHLGTH